MHAQAQAPTVNGTTNPPANRGAEPDPVIHMLAKRASTNPELTALMKTVAGGSANDQQLKIFQQHIDELTAELAKQREEEARNTKPTLAPPTANSVGPRDWPNPQLDGSSDSPADTPMRNSAFHETARTKSPYSNAHQPPPSHPVQANLHGQTAYQSSSHIVKPNQFASPPRPETRTIILEFEKGGDKFLFPRYSILEYVPGTNMVIVSFLIIRRGSDIKVSATSSSSTTSKDASASSLQMPVYDPKLDYYQPVTVRFFSEDFKVISTLRHAVAPPDEVRRWMDDIMDKMTRAEYVYLAMRLPRTAPGDSEEEDGWGGVSAVENGVAASERGDAVDGEKNKKAKKVVRIE
jgi:hypothetical protein